MTVDHIMQAVLHGPRGKKAPSPEGGDFFGDLEADCDLRCAHFIWMANVGFNPLHPSPPDCQGYATGMGREILATMTGLDGEQELSSHTLFLFCRKAIVEQSAKSGNRGEHT